MFAKQRGLCAICHEESDNRFSIDHDHNDGKVRGLLCSECNLGLGKFKDNVDNMLRAIDYLEMS
jgi:hypothetical protein